MSNNTRFAVAQPTITAGAYSANDAVGAVITLEDAALAGSAIHSVVLWDNGNVGAQMDIFFFNAEPANPISDNGAFSIHANDITKLIGSIPIATSDYVAAGSDKIATVRNIGFGFAPTLDGNLYAQMVTRGTPTYGSTSDLRLQVLVIPL